MTWREILKALAAAALIVPLMAAAAFGLLVLSTATADHPAIARAIAGAPPADLGFPAIDQRRNGWREGFFPECAGLSLLLGEARAPNAAVAAIRSETILPPPERTICADLQTVLYGVPDDVTWFTYARYWHGSLLLHRAVLGVADYAALQAVSFGLAALALIALLGALAWRVAFGPAVLVVLALGLLTDAAAVGLLPMQAVSLTALFACAAAFAAWAAPRDGASVLIAAGIAGALYNFLDFFCNPECLAALCAWAWAAGGIVRGRKRTAPGAGCVFAAVLGGYALFWAAKWAIAAGYAATGDTLFLFGGGDAERWGPGTAGWYPGLAAGSVIGQAFDAWWKGGVAAALIGVAAAMWRLVPPSVSRCPTSRPAGGSNGSALGAGVVLLMPVALAWLGIEAIAGHTVVHTAITFRIVPLTLGLLLASAAVLQMTSAARKAAISAAE